MRNLLTREPVLVANVIKAALVCAVAFGLPLSGDQTAAVVGLVVPILALGALTRSVVYAPARVAEVVTDAATQTAERLTSSTVGVAGKVTAPAARIIDEVVAEVVPS